MKKKKIIILSAIVVFIAIALYVAAPILIKNYLVGNSKKLVGRKIAIGNLSGNVYTGRYEFRDVVVFEPDEESMFVCFDTIVLKTSLVKLLSNKVNFDEMKFVNITANIEQTDTAFNFSDIINFFSKTSNSLPQNADELDEPDESAQVILNNIAIKNCKINYIDKTISKEWQSGNISLKIPGLNFGGSKNTDVGVDINFENGGRLTSKLTYTMGKHSYVLDINISNLNLDQLLPYVQKALKLNELNGLADAHIVAQGDALHVLNSKIGGNLVLRNANVINNRNEQLGSVDSLCLSFGDLNIDNFKFKINNFYATGLNLFFEQSKKGNNYSDILSDTARSNWFDNFNLVVDNFKIENSAVNYADNTLDDDFKFAVEDIAIEAINFDINKSNNIILNGNFSNGGRVFAQWEGSFRNLDNVKFEASINNFNLNEISLYSERYLGYPISDGVLSAQLRNNIARGNVDGFIDVNIYNAKVEKKKKSNNIILDIPLRTALYVMRDKNGKINLQIPITGNIDYPEFSYGKQISKILLKYVGRIISSPFSFMGKNENPNEIYFDANAADFAPDQFAKIRDVAEFALTKPEMKLKIKQYFNYKKYSYYFVNANDGNKQLAEQKIAYFSEQYNNLLKKYLLQNRLPESAFEISTAETQELMRYTGDCKYVIDANFDNVEK